MNTHVMKACTICKCSKPNTDFNKNSRANDGLKSYCRACQANLKRIYLEKKEEEMNLAKFESKHKNLNSQLKKVFDATPMKEPWAAAVISAEMRRTGTGGADLRATMGCLDNLVCQGLVEEVGKGLFQRVLVKEKQATESRHAEFETPSQEPEMHQKPATASVAAPAMNPIDKLSKLATRLRDLANDMESAALELAEQAEKNEHETAKMRQLQALLKSLG